MPDPTNPNTPATTASNPMASAPSWNEFVNQYWQGPTDRTSYVAQTYGAPTFLKPFGQMNRMFGLDLRGMQGVGWDRLVNSGLLGQYGINAANQWHELLNFHKPDSLRSAENILQQAFRDWQLRQMGQQQQGQPQQQPTETQAVQPQQQPSPAQVLSAFSQVAPVTNPPPLGTYASLLAAMNTPTPPAAQQADPLASWIMQYLRG